MKGHAVRLFQISCTNFNFKILTKYALYILDVECRETCEKKGYNLFHNVYRIREASVTRHHVSNGKITNNILIDSNS